MNGLPDEDTSAREVTFESSDVRLAGTLALGREPRRAACVIMIAGSGQIDRNDSHKRFPLNVFGVFAEYLKKRGFDTLRYDKRGVGDSGGDYWTAGLVDNTSDVAAALEFVREDADVGRDKVFLLGHSEGAYLATRIAAETPWLGGVILLAGGARSCEEELRWQAEQVGKSMKGLQAFIIRLFRIDVVKTQAKQLARVKKSTKDSFRVQLVARINAKWLREFLAYDPSVDLPKITVPVLAITGAKDIQVDPGNLERMAGLVTAPFEYHVLPDVTHLLRSDPGSPGLADYKRQLKRPLEPRLIELVTEWLERQTATSSV